MPDSKQQAQPAAGAAAASLTAAEEAKLGDLLAKRDAAAGQETARMRVTGPHASLHYGGLTITTEYTDVPVHMVAAMTTAAAEAGVQLEQES
jgi:hypothetical protein